MACGRGSPLPQEKERGYREIRLFSGIEERIVDQQGAGLLHGLVAQAAAELVHAVQDTQIGIRAAQPAVIEASQEHKAGLAPGLGRQTDPLGGNLTSLLGMGIAPGPHA